MNLLQATTARRPASYAADVDLVTLQARHPAHPLVGTPAALPIGENIALHEENEALRQQNDMLRR